MSRRAVAQRVGLLAQAVIAAMGAYGLWTAQAEGHPVSRPSAIAFWAGLVGLIASVAGPRLRARLRRDRTATQRVAD